MELSSMARRLINLSSFILILLPAFLVGCSMSFLAKDEVGNSSKGDFAHYVEGVFRLQNSVTSELMELQESEAVVDQSALLKAEQAMQEACAPLNEYVSKETDGAGASFFLKRKVQKTAVQCESSANFVRLTLKNQPLQK